MRVHTHTHAYITYIHLGELLDPRDVLAVPPVPPVTPPPVPAAAGPPLLYSFVPRSSVCRLAKLHKESRKGFLATRWG